MTDEEVDDLMQDHGMCCTGADRNGIRDAFERGRRAAIEEAALKATSFARINDMGFPERIADAIVELLRHSPKESE